DGDEITIDSKRRVFSLISEIQNEVHRFAIEYHRKKSSSASKSLTLMEIEGVGKQRAKELIKAFKTIDKISKASVEELMSVKGISKAVAENIYNHFHKEKQDTEN
ncbi:MAG TPA: helix-hairpin-helix domain-containing protein, partial [Clostridiales bacterium]|nr:helix-hairpin-helix domain-containing protein [Clostridiales bacterium]